MTSKLKNVRIHKLHDIVNKYNNTHHITIKMKPVDVKDNTYIDLVKKVMIKILNLKLVIMQEYQNTNWSKEVFAIKKIKNTVPWTFVINDLNVEEIIGTFYEKELQKTSQKEFPMGKVIKKKGDKLYVKWKGYDNLFNS